MIGAESWRPASNFSCISTDAGGALGCVRRGQQSRASMHPLEGVTRSEVSLQHWASFGFLPQRQQVVMNKQMRDRMVNVANTWEILTLSGVTKLSNDSWNPSTCSWAFGTLTGVLMESEIPSLSLVWSRRGTVMSGARIAITSLRSSWPTPSSVRGRADMARISGLSCMVICRPSPVLITEGL